MKKRGPKVAIVKGSALNLRLQLPALLLFNREAHKVLWGRATEGHRNHCQDVDEWLPVLPEVDDLDTDFDKMLNCVSHVVNHVLVDILALRRSHNRAAGCLKEPAVLTEDLTFRVSGQMCEGIRRIDDGTVRFVEVTNYKGTRGVYKADVDDWVWSLGEAPENTHHIKTTGRVDAWVDD